MNDHLGRGTSTAPLGLQLAVCGAALVLSAAVLALWDRHAESLPVAGIVSLRADRDAASVRLGTRIEAPPQRVVAELPAPAVVRPDSRTSDVTLLPGTTEAAPLAPVAPADTLDASASLAAEVDRTALLEPVARAEKPGRHEAIAARLGWTAGDARTKRLEAWLIGRQGSRDIDLVAAFGAADAAAIAQDLAPVVVEER